jgi:hypothetical protein
MLCFRAEAGVTPWAVRYYRDQRGRLPVALFFELPSAIGITKLERVKFYAYLALVREHGLDLIARRSSVLEPLRGESNLYSIRLRGTTNNPRVLACALRGHRSIVLLHAFKELRPSAYRREVPVARRLRDLVVADPETRVDAVL